MYMNTKKILCLSITEKPLYLDLFICVLYTSVRKKGKSVHILRLCNCRYRVCVAGTRRRTLKRRSGAILYPMRGREWLFH
jgi:hypothetical protein